MNNQRNPTISKGVDSTLIWLYLLLVAIGLMSIFSVTYHEGDEVVKSFLNFKTNYSKQLIFFAVSLLIGLFILLTDSKFFTATANIWYAFGILLLLLVFPFHTNIKGTESIIKLGGFNLQPAELCKVFVCLALAKYLSRVETDFSKTRSHLMAAGIVCLPLLITIAQKETGLALVFLAFFLVMFREGLPAGYLIIGFSLAVLVVATLLIDKDILAIILTVVAVIAIYFGWRFTRQRRELIIIVSIIWVTCVGVQRFAVPFIFTHVLQKHQVERIFSLIGRENPYAVLNTVEGDEPVATKKDTDYNVRQSKIAIGSGGFVGRGFLKGTQTRFDFVPEQSTDFIFCTIGEGFGFLGSLAVLGIYIFLLLRIVNIAERQRSVFSRCYAYGVASVFFFHIAINICMTIGLAPVIGIPLPFVSYGGTSLISFSTMLFILVRLDADRQMVLR
ncbi:cell cycle protein [Niastella yeongjuensis]|uniref:Cell wall polymerase n=1 Tax=Niastella yeongjuensis TaxID=354355 RepID=A0A1V9EXX3_9BACT|nr:rod shape-determining protein RodA [Niastella yeongjuensis]OQP50926.1 cell cycle protein [Niastella yeongjuensis]SEN11145.1 rod shape determining protein RodA [Niastella yeongjuensis]